MRPDTELKERRRIAGIAFAVSGAAIVFGAAMWFAGYRDEQGAAKHADKALELYRSGDVPAAEKAIEAGLVEHRRVASLLLAKATIRLDQGQWERAAEAATASVKAKPTAEAYELLGLAFARQARLLDAHDAISRAMRLKPKAGVLYLERAELGLRLARFKESTADAGRALQLGLGDPDRVKALRLRARSHAAVGELEDAIKDLDEALKLVPQDTLGRLLRAQLKSQTKDFDGVVADADAVLTDDPANGPAYVLRAEARIGKGDKKEALQDLKKAERFMPGEKRIASLIREAKNLK